MSRITSHDSSQHRSWHTGEAAWRRPPAFPVLLALAIIALIPQAQAQSGALAKVEAQIHRYGCHLPQYRDSVDGCIKLNARARALRAAGHASAGPSRVAAPSYRAGTPLPELSRPAPPVSSGGIFGFLFGAPKPGLYRRPGVYDSGQDRYYSPSFNAGPMSYGRYRTMCVRLCDGFYFPISDATTRARFEADAQRCESSCSAPAKLFFHASGGGSPDTMIDLQGLPYSSIENAYRYRKEYIADCRCKPEPWSEAAKAEYARRADEALDQVAGTGADDDSAPYAQPAHASGPQPAQADVRPQPRRRRGWDTFLPEGRFSTGG